MISKKTLGMVCKVLNSKLGVGAACSSVNRIKKYGSSQKDSKKGFTLVELIVVLVVIAVLAAAVGPALLGFIDNANEKKYITEAKEALTATQSMLSDAYTDGMKYLPRSMRNKALETSGLDGDKTQFIVKTVNNYSETADGTYNSIGAYTVQSALYMADNGSYIYYDSAQNDWRVLDQDNDADKAIIAAMTVKSSTYAAENYIVVWPSDSSLAANDSASSANNEVAVNDEGEEEVKIDNPTEENTKVDDNGEEDTGVEPSGGETDVDHVSLTLVGQAGDQDATGNVIFVNGNSGKANIVAFDDANTEFTYTTTYYNDGENDGYFEAGMDPTNKAKVTNETLFDDSTLKWVKSDDASVSYTGIDGIKNYLDTVVHDDDTQSVTFVAQIAEKSDEIPVSFFAYNSDTQTVEVKDGDKDSDGDEKLDTKNAVFGMVSKAVVFDIDMDESNLVVTPKNLTSGNEGGITFDDEWSVKDPDSSTDTNIVCYKNSDNTYKKLSTSAEILEEVTVRISDMVLAADGTVSSDGLEKAETTGVTFLAPAEIHKTLYVRGTLTQNDYTGTVHFGETEDNYSISEEYAKYELDDQIYSVDASGNRENALSFEGADAYSIFAGDNAIAFNGAAASKLKIKTWNLFKCKKNLSDAELKNTAGLTKDGTTREKDELVEGSLQAKLSEYLIETKLYSSENYGELAEVDVSATTTKFIDGDGESPIRNIIKQLANGKIDYITSINYLNEGDSIAPSSETFKEMCLSTSTVRAGNIANHLAREDNGNGPFIILDSDRKDDYPAYTVAYSIQRDNPDYKAGDPADTKYLYDIYVLTEDYSDIYVDKSCQKFNSNCQRMTTNTVIAHMDTADVTNMASMFETCYSLQTDISLNVDSVTSLNKTFKDCGQLTNVTLDASNKHANTLTNIGEIFNGANNLKNVTINGIQTSSVNNVNSLFSGKANLESVAFNNVSLTGVTSTSGMFKGCSGLASVDFSSLKLGTVTNASSMFEGCSSLNTVSFGEFNLSTATNLSKTFMGCSTLPAETLTGLDTKNAKDMSYMFANCTQLTELTEFHIDNAENLYYIFKECSNLQTVTFVGKGNKPSTSSPLNAEGNNMKEIFYYCPIHTLTVKNIYFSNLDTFGTFLSGGGNKNVVTVNIEEVSMPKAISAEKWFMDCTSMQSIAIKKFTTNITSTKSMFENCKSLISFTFEDFTTGEITDMTSMYKSCQAATSIPVDTFDTANVKYMSEMFRDCYALQDIDFSSFDTRNVEKMDWMFGNSQNTYNTSLIELDISSFKTDKLENIQNMFIRCKSLRTIYVDPTQWKYDQFKMGTQNNNGPGWTTFKGCESLEGGNGTTCVGVAAESRGNVNQNILATSGMYALADEAEGEDLNGDGRNGDRGYFTAGATQSRFKVMENNQWPKSFGLTNANMASIKNFARCTDYSTEEDMLEAKGSSAKEVQDADQTVKIYAWVENNTIYWWSEANVVYIHPDTKQMFRGSNNGFTQIQSIDFQGIDTSQVKDFSWFFEGCKNLTEIVDGSTADRVAYAIDTSGAIGGDVVTNQGGADSITVSLEGVSTALNDQAPALDGGFVRMFDNCQKLTTINLSKFNTSNVNSMFWMFRKCYGLTSIDCSTFDSSSLYCCDSMFFECKNLKEIKFGSRFNGKKLISMQFMFANCTALQSVDLSSFDSSITDEVSYKLYTKKMFDRCGELKTVYALDPSDPANNGCAFSYSIPGVFESRLDNNSEMFSGCSLVGGNGSSGLGNQSKYALIDKEGQAGYFTAKTP